MLTRAASEHVEAEGCKDEIVHKLMALGSKRASNFFGQENGPLPVFSGLDAILPLLNGPEERISLLRRLTSHLDHPESSGSILIRYFLKEAQFTGATTDLCGLASAVPRVKVPPPPGDRAVYYHSRWVPSAFQEYNGYPGEHVDEISEGPSLSFGKNSHTFYVPKGAMEIKDGPFHYRFGSPEYAAIYVSTSENFRPELRRGQIFRDPTVEDVMWCLDSGMFHMSKVVHRLTLGADPLSPQTKTLKALSAAYRVYRNLPDATISAGTLNSPLYAAKWAARTNLIQAGSKYDRLQRGRDDAKHIDQKTAFSCVAYFDGDIDVRPDDLGQVFAVAYEDSIYVSMQVRSLGMPAHLDSTDLCII